MDKNKIPRMIKFPEVQHVKLKWNCTKNNKSNRVIFVSHAANGFREVRHYSSKCTLFHGFISLKISSTTFFSSVTSHQGSAGKSQAISQLQRRDHPLKFAYLVRVLCIKNKLLKPTSSRVEGGSLFGFYEENF